MKLLLITAFFLLILGGCPDDGRENEFYELVDAFGMYGDDLGQFNTPMGLVIRRLRQGVGYRIFVADHGNNRVLVLPILEEMNLDSIRIITEPPGGLGDTIWPIALTVTQSDFYDLSKPVPDSMYIYITDSRNHRVCKYDLEGNL